MSPEHDHVLVSYADTIKNETTTIQDDKVVDVVDSILEGKSEPKPRKRIRKKPEYQHCFICGLRCRYLNRHIGIMHSDGVKYECDICKTPKYWAKSKGQLYIHMGAKHINKIET